MKNYNLKDISQVMAMVIHIPIHSKVILIAMILSPLIRSLASDEIDILKNEARKAAFISAATNDVDEFKNIERAVIIDSVNRAFMANPTLKQDDLLDLYNKAQDKINIRLRDSEGNYKIPQGYQTGFDFFNSVINPVKEVPILAVGASAVQETLNQGVKLYELKNASQAQIEAQKGMYSDYVGFRDWQSQTISQALSLSDNEPEFRDAFNVKWAPEFNATTFDSFETILTNNSNLQSNPIIQGIQQKIAGIEAGGLSLQEFQDQLKLLTIDQYNQINTLIEGTRQQIVELDNQQKSLIDYFKNPNNRTEEQIKADNQRKKDQKDIKIATIGVEALSKLIGHFDAKAGARVGGIGNAGIQIFDAISKYKFTMHSGDVVSKFGSFVSGVTLALDIGGAIAGIVAMFQPQGPSPDEIILEQIAKLSEQIENFRVEMHERFDRIDKSLNSIYALLSDTFAALKNVSERIDYIRESILRIQDQLSQMEANLRTYLENVYRADFVSHFDNCPDYGWRLYQNPQDRFVDCIESFKTWATQNSKVELLSGTSTGVMDDLRVLQELQKPLVAETTFLAHLAADRFGNPYLRDSSNDGRLANPLEWALAVEAYLKMLEEFPDFVTKNKDIIVRHIDDMFEVGNQITSGSKGLRTPAFFSLLTKNYTEKANLVLNEIKKIEQSLGDPNYVPPLVMEVYGTGFLGDQQGYTGETLSPPDGYQDLIPVPFRIATQAGLWQPLRITISLHFNNRKEYINCPCPGCTSTMYVPSGNIETWIQCTMGSGWTLPVFERDRMTASDDWWYGWIDSHLCWGCAKSCYSLKEFWESGDNPSIEIPFRNSYLSMAEERFSQDEIKQSIDVIEFSLQVELRKRIRDNLDMTSPLNDAVVQLSAAEEILSAFIDLVLPKAKSSNDYLMNLIVGSEKIYNREILIQYCNTTFSSTDNKNKVISYLTYEINRRINALQELLNIVLSEEDLFEEDSLLSGTMLSLENAKNLINNGDFPQKSVYHIEKQKTPNPIIGNKIVAFAGSLYQTKSTEYLELDQVHFVNIAASKLSDYASKAYLYYDQNKSGAFEGESDLLIGTAISFGVDGNTIDFSLSMNISVVPLDRYFLVLESKENPGGGSGGDVSELQIQLQSLSIKNIESGEPVYVGGLPGTGWKIDTALLKNLVSGDSNMDSQIDLADAINILAWLFIGSSKIEPRIEDSDVNNDGTINLTDVIYILKYLYQDGPAPIKSNRCYSEIDSACQIYVNGSYSGFQDGSQNYPFNTLGHGRDSVSKYGKINILPGNYENLILDKPMTLIAPNGSVIIGQ